MNFRTLKISDVLNLSDSDIDEMDSSTLQKYLTQAQRWATQRKTRALAAFTTGKSQDIIIGRAYEDIGTKPIYTKAGKKKWTGIRDIENWQEVDFYDIGRDDKEKLKIAIKFLSTKTSTVYGQTAYLKEIKSRLEINTGIRKISDIRFKEFWKIVYAKLGELTAQTSYMYSSDKGKSYIPTKEFQRLVWEEMKDMGEPTQNQYNEDVDNDEYAQKVLKSLKTKLDKNYEERMIERNEDNMESEHKPFKLSTKF